MISSHAIFNPTLSMNILERKVWLCDICKEATFEDFDEACRHEEDCLKSKNASCTERKKGEIIEEKSKIFSDQKTISKSSKTTTPKTEKGERRIHEATNETTHVLKRKGEEVLPLEERNVITDISDSGDVDDSIRVLENEKKETKLRKRRRSTRLEKKIKKRIIEDKEPETLSSKSVSQERNGGNNEKDGSHDAKEDGSLKQSKIPFNKILNNDSEYKGGDDSRRKRVKCRQTSMKLSRCRQTSKTGKKSTAPFAAIFHGKSKNITLAEQRSLEFAVRRRMEAEKERERQQKRIEARTLKTAEKINAKKPNSQRSKKPSTERFPLQTHINAADSPSNIDSIYCAVGRHLRLTLKYPMSRNVFNRKSICQMRGPELLSKDEPVIDLLSSILSSIPRKTSKLEERVSWTEKYSIHAFPNDLIGAWNRKIGKKCVNFIDSWKVERQRARRRRAEKQEKLLSGKRRRRRREDLWESSDDESQLPAVVILTGPTGCGKTSMVYAVAKQCECKVLEMNTTERRDSQHLKNAIEETTLSDSTFDLLKNSTEASSPINRKNEDSDEEVEGGSSVPIILLDEINILFDNGGDSGFWPALKALSKKAKCPIFLTANDFPKILNDLSIDFHHFQMEYPSQNECVEKIWPILKSAGFHARQGVCSEKLKRYLSYFAEMLECDMRRILNALELFTYTRSSPNRAISPLLAATTVSSYNDLYTERRPHFIKKLTPSIFAGGEMGLLTIELSDTHSLGENFSVYIGDQKCRNLKLNDEGNILVSCPPYCAEHCTVESEGEEICISTRYPLISIRSNTLKRWLTNGKHVEKRTLLDGSNLSNLSLCNIEYSLESADSTTKLEQSFRFSMHEEKNKENTFVPLTGSFEEPINVREEQNVGNCGLQELIKMAHMFELESDLNFLQESICTNGMPSLAGSSRGFGSTFVDGDGFIESHSVLNKLSKTENKTPSFERIILNGWNDYQYFFGNSDYYLTNPLPIERRKLSYIINHKDNSFIASSNQSAIGDDCPNNNSEEEFDNAQFGSLPEEDALISHLSPIELLPDHVRNLCSNCFRMCNLQQMLLTPRKKIQQNKLKACLLRIWNNPDSSFILGISRGRSMSCLGLKESDLENQVYADYRPLLASICVSERALLSNPSITTGVKQELMRRSTRSLKKDIRSHYFCKTGSFYDSNFEEDCSEVGKQLADQWLEY